MLNVSVQRLERTTSFFFVDNIIDGKKTDIELFVFPLNSKAHRDALAEIERVKESGEEVDASTMSATVAAYLLDSHNGLEDDGKPVKTADKRKLTALLTGEHDLVSQILEHAKKKNVVTK